MGCFIINKNQEKRLILSAAAAWGTSAAVALVLQCSQEKKPEQDEAVCGWVGGDPELGLWIR